MVVGIMRGVIAFIVSAILGGICLLFGFSPDEWIATFVAEPPLWLLHPLSRLGSILVGGFFGFLAWKFWPWRSRSLREVDKEYVPTIRMSVGEAGPYFSTDGSVYGIRRTYNLKLENIAQSNSLSDCAIHVMEVVPPTDYEGPWLLRDGITLAAGAHIFTPLVTYGEPREPKKYGHGDTFMTMGTPTGHPFLDVGPIYTVTLRATARDTRFYDFQCRVWVDKNARLKIEDV